MKKAVSIVLCAIMLCAAFAGCAKDPNEGVTYREVKPVDQPVKAGNAVRKGLTTDDIVNNAAMVFRGVVTEVKEYELIALRDLGITDYTTRFKAQVIDPIYGDIQKGDNISALYASSSYFVVPDAQVLENGKEYIFILSKLPIAPENERIFDRRSLSENCLISSKDGFMPVDENGIVTYPPFLGNLNGKGTYDGEIVLNREKMNAYRADYEDLKSCISGLFSDAGK